MTDWRDIAAAELRGRIAGLREAAGIVASGKYIYVADTTWSKDRSTSSVCSAGKNLVAIDIATGQILALASTPLLRRADSKKPPLVKGDDPWMNRCVEAIYPPGSTVKPGVILAGLSERRIDSDLPVITAQSTYDCPTSEFDQPSCRGHSHYSVGPADADRKSVV